ncbi:hypothetical protein Rhe02_46070 [Rhizocola hellebori]|uniref:Suppressor of fused-like domain-containing protein n=1 Tax=Rhizocola hellebori TaxID=1392758 RepID=A0A8J3Q9Q7_9ACTN|nr:suppressor of fused domain protein [Rhizocola hellebori]GIH06540.1 hypothetical protein Rhe02_46070 [Rhizocola hellebori]
MTQDADAGSDYPGWDAINAALEPLYPGVDPLHWGTLIKWRLGGPDPLDGVSVYSRDDHWHYVSYGMSELYEKESDIAETSGWGFEFTIRVARRPDADPPIWPANLLQNLARYVFTTGNNFAAGHHMTLNGPIDLEDENTLIRYIAFCADPELGRIDTPHGELTFLQVVGLTDAEYEAAQAWNTEKLLETLSERLPLLVTDPARQSLLDDPALAQAVAEGISRDGSSSASSWATQLDWHRPETGTLIVLGALAAPNIATSLRGRLPFGRHFGVYAEQRELQFLPGDHLDVTEPAQNTLHVTIPAHLVDPLCAALVTARASTVQIDPMLSIEIVPTEIKDQSGQVIEVVGLSN